MEWNRNIQAFKIVINSSFTEYTEYKAAMWIWRLCSPILILFGSVGNILSLIVLVRKRLRSSPTMFFLTVLALVDLSVLYIGLLRLWFEYSYEINLRESSEFACRVHTFLVYFTLSYSVWIIVAVTIDRCIIVCAPFKAKTLSSLSKAKKTVLIIAIILICFNAHILETQALISVKYFEGGIRCSHAKHSEYFRDYVWPWIDFGLNCFIPFTVMIVCNLLIIRRISLSARKLTQHIERDQPKSPSHTLSISRGHRLSVLPLANSTATVTSNTESTPANRVRDTAFSFHPQVSVDVSRKAQNRSTSLTIMLLVVSFVFMLLVLPITVFLIGFQVWIETADPRTEAKLELGWALVNMLQYTNNSIHFFLYSLTGPRFRREFLSLFKKKFGQKKIEPSDTVDKEASPGK
ncbi:hypothetical protein LOTGIDRAFT_158793 [Lottia gigantea]|uniref:G-protein coupled receptors family 1 profile domain-containing protein n=1 Tax=Lottia gigantea TaxID=225164 RepID=V4A4P0_LOTGI|nr:hypothetical protein LOTGIDRAFT_158793 [Lottia gigantea]ESO98843.1 hypothetical protein LOTGIDRAFT_158793 [Lottia gigantea]